MTTLASIAREALAVAAPLDPSSGMSLTKASPDNSALRILSDITGWTYFTIWTVSFYPQIYLNYKKQSVQGLSYDYAAYNSVGFTCLLLFSCVRSYYQNTYNLPRAVAIQDVAFALNAVVASFFTFLQIVYYDREKFWIRISRHCKILIVIFFGVTAVHLALMNAGIIDLSFGPQTTTVNPPDTPPPPQAHQYFWSAQYTFTSWLGLTKVFVTLYKYYPQVRLNFKRQSTVGLSVWQYNLDCAGGIFSLSQIVIDSIRYGDAKLFTGNIPKLCIALIGLGYNSILITQHYFLYRRNRKAEGRRSLSYRHSTELLDLPCNETESESEPSQPLFSNPTFHSHPPEVIHRLSHHQLFMDKDNAGDKLRDGGNDVAKGSLRVLSTCDSDRVMLFDDKESMERDRSRGRHGLPNRSRKTSPARKGSHLHDGFLNDENARYSHTAHPGLAHMGLGALSTTSGVARDASDAGDRDAMWSSSRSTILSGSDSAFSSDSLDKVVEGQADAKHARTTSTASASKRNQENAK